MTRCARARTDAVSHAAVETVSPLRDDSRKRRFVKLAGWAAALVVILVVSKLLGWDLVGWFQNVWDQVTAISLGSLVAGCFFQTVQTTLTAMSWLFILRAAYPKVTIGFRPILAAYAVSVAMNNVLPANMGTFALLIMFVALIPGSTFPGIFAGYLVQKIFFTVIGAFVYLYLFLSVPEMTRRRLALPELELVRRPPRPHDPHRRGRRVPPRAARPGLLAPGQEAVGEGEGRRRDPAAPPRSTSSRCSCPRSAAGWRSSA